MSGTAETGSTRTLVVCDDATIPAAWSNQGWETVPVRSHGQDPELNLRVDGLGTRYIGRLDERANDLVRIAAYTFAADQTISRGGKGDPNRRRWRRELALCVPVSDPGFWSDEDTTAALSETLDFGTEDRWEFAFSLAPAEDRHLQLAFDVDARAVLADPDCVALLSGGIDSLCATVEAVAVKQRRPVLVSHRTAPPVAAPQRRLVHGLEEHFPEWLFPHLSFWIHKRGKEPVERTRRTRGFLIAALGAAVAGQVGLSTVLLPDNGYVSINPPVNAQLVGALNSRGTHPTFLRLVNRLLDLAFPGRVQLENPLAHRTRTEALSLLTEHGCETLLSETRSCSHSRRPTEKPHCGVCSQCVDRRIATVAAGLEPFDPPGRYGVDIFTAALPEGEPRVFATSFVGHAQRVDKLDAEELFSAFPELDACLDLNGGSISASATALADVLKRHADEVLRVIGMMVSRHGDAFARRGLPTTCLLQFAIDPGPEQRADINEWPSQGDGPSAEEHFARRTDHSDRPRLEKIASSWWVTFETEKGLIKHSIGMERLARLLKAPGQELKALDLVTGSSPRASSRNRGTTGGVVDSDGMSATGDLGEILDPTALTNYRKRAEELKAELAEPGSETNEELLDERRDELDRINKQLAAATGRRGKGRKVPNEHEKARQTVVHTIGAALDAIERQFPELKAHLKEALHLSHTCSYNPRPPLHWDVLP